MEHSIQDPSPAAVSGSNPDRFRRTFLLILALAISVGMYLVIQPFFLTLVMGAIFAGLSFPLYARLTEALKGREGAAALITLLGLVVGIFLPFTAFLGVLANEAVQISDSVGPWIQSQIDEPDRITSLARRVPIIGERLPGEDVIISKLGEIAGGVGGFLLGVVTSATRGTMNFFLQLFVLLYSMYFFLVRGQVALDKILYVSPLSSRDEDQLVARFVSVTRATLKGSLVIGIVQGGLAGLGFAVVGIPSAVFWGTIMAVLSIIPAVGAALVWVPAVIYLFVTSQVGAGILLLVWCGGVVGTADNFLRPMLVGRDTKMPDLLVLLSTLGGISLFGILGFILGPIVAALFLTVWDLFGESFGEFLPGVERGGDAGRRKDATSQADGPETPAEGPDGEVPAPA